VPCGSATQKVEKATNVQLKPVSEESQVTDVLNKITTGQADAGLVYVTDARSAGGAVSEVKIPGALNVLAIYPIAPVASSIAPTRLSMGPRSWSQANRLAST